MRLASSSVMWLTLLVMTFAIAQEALVQEYEGNGALNTRPFTVVPGWEIQWDASGDIFQLYLHDGAGDLIGVAANQMGPGRGASYQPRAGTYYLQVNALGRWTIRIVQITTAPTQVSAGPAVFGGDGAQNTRPFSTSGPWEIQWDASGDIFQLYLHDGAGDLIGVAGNQMGPGRGASYQPRAGTYYLQVNALGRWSIRIVSIN